MSSITPDLDPAEQHYAAAGAGWISAGALDRAIEGAVIGDVGDVESRLLVPPPIRRRRKFLAAVPRVTGVRMKIDDHVIRRAHDESRQRSRQYRSAGVKNDQRQQRQ